MEQGEPMTSGPDDPGDQVRALVVQQKQAEERKLVRVAGEVIAENATASNALVVAFFLFAITPLGPLEAVAIAALGIGAVKAVAGAAGEEFGERAGKAAAAEVRMAADQALREIDDALDQSVNKAFAAAAILVWGSTTAAAVGLLYHAHQAASGGTVPVDPQRFASVIAGVFIFALNLSAVIRVVHAFRAIPAPWSKRVVGAIAHKFKWWYAVLALGPIGALSIAAIMR